MNADVLNIPRSREMVMDQDVVERRVHQILDLSYLMQSNVRDLVDTGTIPKRIETDGASYTTKIGELMTAVTAVISKIKEIDALV